MAARIGDREPVIGVVGDAAHDGIVGGAVGEADDAGGKGEQVEQPDHGEQRQHAEDIGLGLGAAEVISATAIATMPAATSSTSTMLPLRRAGSWAAKRLGGRMAVGFGGHIRRRGPSAGGGALICAPLLSA